MDTTPQRPLHQCMNSHSPLQITRTEGLIELCLRREAARNALSTDLLKALADAFEEIGEDPTVRLVHLTGAGRDFCAGFDLEHLGAQALSEGLTETLVRGLADLGHRMLTALRAVPAVTVASIQGNALGGGFLLAAACDFRVIARSARIALPEVNLGMPLIWGGVPLLLEELSPASARDLMMTGRPLDPESPQFEGFASRTCTPEQLPSASSALLETLLSKPPHALRLLKRQCVHEGRSANATQANEADTAVDAILHPDFLPTVMAAIQRRGASGD